MKNNFIIHLEKIFKNIDPVIALILEKSLNKKEISQAVL